MALKVPQSSFSAGELDPALHERTTLQKYKTGLATGRNWVVSKTGSLITRPSRKYVSKCQAVGYLPRIHIPEKNWMIEIGAGYIRTYFNDSVVGSAVHTLTQADMPKIKFETSGFFVYIFVAGKNTLMYKYDTWQFVNDPYYIPPPPLSNPTNTPTGTPAGYPVDYLVTYVINGEESLGMPAINIGQLPIANSQSNKITGTLAASSVQGITEMRVYRRPTNGGAFGYVGSSTYLYVSGGNVLSDFTDFGQSADYSQSQPVLLENTHPNVPGLINWRSNVGVVYQQRLVVTNALDPEAILASRAGFKNNFFKDGTITATSALKFKAGSSGRATIYDLLDADGLVAFTSRGIFLNQGALGPANVALNKKGAWVIKQDVRPLAVPGGVFFIDEATNTVRNLIWSQDLAGYNAQEVSIFSNHLFTRRTVVSWAFQSGVLPVLWAVYSDGTFASFTYEFDQEMRAWTRHDSVLPVRAVAATEQPDITYFIVQDGDNYYIEKTVPRFISAAEYAVNPEADMGIGAAFMDTMWTYSDMITRYLTPGDNLTLTPVNGDDWAGPLTLQTAATSAFLTNVIYGKVGAIFRMFDEDGSSYDLKVIARTNDYTITVQCDKVFPEYMRMNPRLYNTVVSINGIPEIFYNKSISVLIDGKVVASPNNDIENYPDVVPTGFTLDFAEENRFAILVLGLPVNAADIETLDIDTVEQAPTLIESKTVNKVYVKTKDSKGLYVGHRFPPNNKVNTWVDDESRAMQSLDEYHVDYSQEEPIIANRVKPPESRRHEISLPGDWSSNGRIAIRQVDPYHSQILSIIPDVDVLSRSDR